MMNNLSLPAEFNSNVLLIIIFAIPFVWSIVWAYKDAKLRGKQPILVASLVALLSWPVSLLVWLVFRPDKK